jgi:hypothetical protein
MRDLRRNRSLLGLGLLIFVAACAVWWLAFASNVPPGGLVINVQPSGNAANFASCQLTNRSKRLISYRFMVESKHEAEWPVYLEGTGFPDPGQARELRLTPSESTNFVVGVPTNGRWRVSVLYWETESRRDSVCAFLRTCGLNLIADKLSADKPAYRAYGPEYGN